MLRVGARGGGGMAWGGGEGAIVEPGERLLGGDGGEGARGVDGEEVEAAVSDEEDEPGGDEGGSEGDGEGFAKGAAVFEELGAGGFVAEVFAVDGDEEDGF